MALIHFQKMSFEMCSSFIYRRTLADNLFLHQALVVYGFDLKLSFSDEETIHSLKLQMIAKLESERGWKLIHATFKGDTYIIRLGPII